MKSVLIVIALLVSTASVECSSNSEILGKLTDLLMEASLKNNQAAVNAVTEAMETVGLAITLMVGKDEATKNMYQSHIDAVRSDLSKLENMINQQIKTRGFFSAIGGAFNYTTSKASLLTHKVQSILSNVAHSGFSRLNALFEPFLEHVKNSPHLKQLIGGLEIITSALEQLNKMTGGMFEPLNAVTDILSNIESTGKLFESMSSANSSDAIADALINTLVKAKSGHAQKIEKALDYVCNGVEDAGKSS